MNMPVLDADFNGGANKTTRRKMLAAAVAAIPAATVASLGTALAAGDVDAAVDAALFGDAPESPIMQLYRRYAEISRAAQAYVYGPADDHDEVSNRLFYAERDTVEDALMALVPTTAQDMAAKALVSHCHGDMSCLDFEQSAFWIEARALVEGAV